MTFIFLEAWLSNTSSNQCNPKYQQMGLNLNMGFSCDSLVLTVPSDSGRCPLRFKSASRHSVLHVRRSPARSKLESRWRTWVKYTQAMKHVHARPDVARLQIQSSCTSSILFWFWNLTRWFHAPIKWNRGSTAACSSTALAFCFFSIRGWLSLQTSSHIITLYCQCNCCCTLDLNQC